MDWFAWVPTLILAAILFLARNWFEARIEKGVQHTFNAKIEDIKTDLRKNEESFKSELRLKESEISALRDSLLNGRASRQALLDRRRIEAVERLWKAVSDLAPYKSISAFMSVTKFDAVAAQAPKNANLRKIFETIGGLAPDTKFPNSAKSERPFVSSTAWAFFSAYQAIVGYAYLQVKVLEFGIEKPEKLFDSAGVISLLKAALPHQGAYIDQYSASAFHYLLDELEAKLLIELQKTLTGQETGGEDLAQAINIMNAVKEVEANNAKGLTDAVSEGITT